jgi:ubiquinone/menaquinone biosynthesis C-methylase UbiE
MNRQPNAETDNAESENSAIHNAVILDQFTRQARPFATSATIRNQGILDRILEIAEPQPDDTVLDVACGPGLLTCAFAHVVRQATGSDLTPAMLEQAKIVQREQGLSNVKWEIGDATALPYKDGEFSIVTTRFTFHHFLNPLAALKEMRRVCCPGGKIVVTDSSPAAAKADAFNKLEILRDPSHVRALPIEELRALFQHAGFNEPRVANYRLEGDLEDLLRHSFPNEGDEARVRQRFEDSLEDDALDLATHRDNATILYGFPVAILAATNPGTVSNRS